MPRIKLASSEIEAAYDAETDPGKRAMIAMAGTMAHMPKATKYLTACKAAAKHGGTLSQRLVELVRIRMAYHTQCRTCMTLRFSECLADGLDQTAVCSLERPQEAEDLSPRERKAIEYCDKFANDWLSIDDNYFNSMRELFTEAEIVQLGFICALHLGSGRLMASYAVTEDLPDIMQGESGDHKYKPWEVDIDALVCDPLPDDLFEDVPESERPEVLGAVA